MPKYQDIFKRIENKDIQLWNLASVFEHLSIQPKHKYEKEEKEPPCSPSYFYEMATLPNFETEASLNESLFFPKKTPIENKEWKAAIEQNDLKQQNLDAYTTYHLAHKYLSRVTDEKNDVVSLFDKYRIEQAKENLNGASQYLLVKGDFSGMQKFIYGGIKTDEAGGTKGLSKKLRGRSFYISVMADMVAETFAEELGLGISNVIYSGGGHFLLLCEKSDSSINTINHLTKKINQFLLENVGSSLSFITGQTICGEDIFEDSSKAMLAVNHDLGGKKYKQNKDNLTFVFGINKEPDFNDDQLLGEKIPKINTILEVNFFATKWDGDMKSEYCKLLREEPVVLGFKKFHKLLIMTDEISLEDLTTIFKTYPNVIKSIKIIQINKNSDFLNDYSELKAEAQKYNINVHFGFRYIGNYTPTIEKKGKTVVMPFEDIIRLNNFPKEMSFEANPYPKENEAHASFKAWNEGFEGKYHGENSLSYPKLAVMRLDVDNLGTIFGFGMGKKASLAKTATLSRELHLFFTGYFSVLAKKYGIYITYSGGDDAFVVGSWIGIAHFAKELYHQFRKFICENGEITFSAGVFLCDEHYPVAKFANDAADLEKRAKDFPNKNAITIFDHTLSFPHYDAMLNFSVKMLKYVRTDDEKADKEKIARSMVHRLLRIIKSCINEDKGFTIKIDKLHRQTANLHRQTANLHYLFARHGFDAKEIELAKANDEKAKAITRDIMEVILSHFKCTDDTKTLVPNFLIPTHYITLLTRKAK